MAIDGLQVAANGVEAGGGRILSRVLVQRRVTGECVSEADEAFVEKESRCE